MTIPESFSSPPGFSHRSRAEQLERSFLNCLRLIQAHQGLQQMPSGYLPDYLALGWLVQRDGAPELTPAGLQMVQTLRSTRRGRRHRRPA